MRDPTIPDTKSRKKIMFYDSEEHQTKLRIRCNYDGITQSQFFRLMISGYIENNELIYKYLEQCKEKFQIQGKNKRDKIDRIKKMADEKTQKFNLGDEEIESIFDIIATETGL
jgi:hypothetical protein